MKRKTLLLTTAAVVVALGTAFAFTAPSFAHGPKGQGFYGGGPMMGGQMGGRMMGGQMGGRMMGGQMGAQMMGPCQGANKAGYGMMGQGMMGQGMMGQGMKGYGPGFTTTNLEKELTTDDVKKFIEGRLAWRGNDRLKVGKVTEKDDKTIVAEIVTVDNSLVWKVEVNRKTGQHRRVTK